MNNKENIKGILQNFKMGLVPACLILSEKDLEVNIFFLKNIWTGQQLKKYIHMDHTILKICIFPKTIQNNIKML